MNSPKNKPRTSELYVRNIPANIKSYFKAYCAKMEKTMSEVIIEFMTSKVRTSKKFNEGLYDEE